MELSTHSLYLSEDALQIYCDIKGDLTYKQAQTIIEELAELSENSKVYSILLDVTQSTNKANAFENYTLAFRKMRLLKHLLKWRIALLIRPLDKSFGFLTTVMLNAGYKAKQFTKRGEAVTWLAGR